MGEQNQTATRQQSCSEEKASSRTVEFVQIAAVGVPNNFQTQCNYVLFGLDRSGRVWQRDDQQAEWERVEHPALLVTEAQS